MPHVSHSEIPVSENIVELVDGAKRPGTRARFEWSSANPIEHFKLETNPFADNVNPDFFFRTESHEEAFILMKQAVEDHAALALCTAPSGTGKTLLSQILLQEIDPERHRAVLALVYPEMSRTALLRDIMTELDIEMPRKSFSIHALLSVVQEEIIRLYRTGKKLLLIIDEAHFLKTDSLHILRTLSNIEVPEKKLITVLLFAEDHFRKRLEHRSYRALLSRMFMRCTIAPLSVDEVKQYIKFRCLMAGGRGDLFADDSHVPIAERTGGIPREINRFAHNALLVAARRGMPAVTGEVIKGIAR